MRTTIHVVVVCALVVFGLEKTLNADVIIQHVGANDPLTEGWIGTSDPSRDGPIVNDNGSGRDAWSLKTNTATVIPDDRFGPNQQFSIQQRLNSANYGWKLTVDLRVVNAANTPDVPDNAVVAWVMMPTYNGSSPTRTGGGNMYWMMFGAEADGDPIVRFFGFAGGQDLTIDLNGLGANYHEYQLLTKANINTADFYVDGNLVQSGIVANPYGGGPQVRFGSYASPVDGADNTGQGNFNLVRFEVVPEPSTLALLALGAIGLLARRRLTGSD